MPCTPDSSHFILNNTYCKFNFTDDVSPLLLGEHYPVTVTDDQSEFSSITLRDRPIRAVSIRANPETSDM